jgi:hypothetical protein
MNRNLKAKFGLVIASTLFVAMGVCFFSSSRIDPTQHYMFYFGTQIISCERISKEQCGFRMEGCNNTDGSFECVTNVKKVDKALLNQHPLDVLLGP